jgi:O-antigen/teichoic acid export membrane protein
VTLKAADTVAAVTGQPGTTPAERAAGLILDTGNPGNVEGSHSGLKHQALRATLWSAVCLWGNRGLTFLFFAVLARLLGPQAFGLVALSSAYVGFLLIFQDQGFSHAVIQRQDLHPDHLNTAFWMNMVLALVLTLATLGAAPWIGQVFQEPQLAGVIRGLSLLLVIGALTSVHRALLYRAFRFRVLAGATIGGVTAGGIVGIVAALQGCGVWSLVFHQIVSRVCESGIIWWYSDWRPGFRWTRVHFRDMFGFGKYVVGGQLASFVYLYAANLIIGFFLGSVAVGLFDVAGRCIRVILQMVSGVISRVSLPVFARLQRNPGEGRAAFLQATNQVALLSFPVFTAIAVLAPEIVATVFGARWDGAIPVMRVLSLAGIAQSVYYLKRYLVLAYGRPKWHFELELLTVILTLTGVLLAVPAGIIAVAWAQVLAQLASFPFLFVAVSRLVHVRLREDARVLLPALMASILTGLTALATKMIIAGRVAPWFVLGLGLLVGATIYLASVRMIDPSSFSRSVYYLRTMLRGKKSTAMPASM